MWHASSRNMTYSYISKKISKYAQFSSLNNTPEIKISKYCIKPYPLFKEGNVLVYVCICISNLECERLWERKRKIEQWKSEENKKRERKEKSNEKKHYIHLYVGKLKSKQIKQTKNHCLIHPYLLFYFIYASWQKSEFITKRPRHWPNITFHPVLKIQQSTGIFRLESF